jgi:hypothetical protein
VQEIENYHAKSTGLRSLFPVLNAFAALSDVAEYSAALGDVDAAEGLESTFSAFFTAAFKNQVQKPVCPEHGMRFIRRPVA